MKISRFIVTVYVVLIFTSAVWPQTNGKRAPVKRIAAPLSSAPSPLVDADTDRLPPNYLGLNPYIVYTVLEKYDKILQKSDFEITSDFHGRLDRVLSQIKLGQGKTADDRITFVVRDAQESYDADSQTFTLKVESNLETLSDDDYSPELLKTFSRTADKRGKSSDANSTYYFTSLDLSNTERTLGSAIGQNAFGVKRRIKVKDYTALRLAMPKPYFSDFNDTITFRASLSQARSASGYVLLAFSGKLRFPFFGRYSDTDTATLSNPEEARYNRYLLFFEPDSIIAYNGHTGEVLASARLPITRDQDSDTGLLPFTLANRNFNDNDPRLKLLQSNPNHVFLSSEVTTPAKIIHSPDPKHPDNAASHLIRNAVVRLRAVLNLSGEITEIEVLQGQPEGLTEKAIEAAKSIEFKPAQINERKVSQYVTLEYTFNRY